MKRTLFCLFFFAFLSLPGKAQRDKAIYERYCTAVKEKAALPTGDLMVETARFFLGTPYVAGTLEEEPETLVINLHGLDCMTLVENTAALAWSVKHRLAYVTGIPAVRHSIIRIVSIIRLTGYMKTKREGI